MNKSACCESLEVVEIYILVAKRLWSNPSLTILPHKPAWRKEKSFLPCTIIIIDLWIFHAVLIWGLILHTSLLLRWVLQETYWFFFLSLYSPSIIRVSFVFTFWMSHLVLCLHQLIKVTFDFTSLLIVLDTMW